MRRSNLFIFKSITGVKIIIFQIKCEIISPLAIPAFSNWVFVTNFKFTLRQTNININLYPEVFNLMSTVTKTSFVINRKLCLKLLNTKLCCMFCERYLNIPIEVQSLCFLNVVKQLQIVVTQNSKPSSCHFILPPK